ncbi:MAG TPA: class I SAM-dependent methyltransferase [bacterium]
MSAPKGRTLERRHRRLRNHWRTGVLAELLVSTPGKTVLNYGCGEGGDRAWMEGRGLEVTAFDVYPSDHSDYVCDGHELPFADSQFDIVTAISVFQYLADPLKGISEIARVLRPGGALVGTVAFLEAQDKQTYFHMTHLGVRELLSRAGFEAIEVYPGWSFRESLNESFWVWNQISALSAIHRAWGRLSFRLGLALWRAGYRMKGKSAPEDLEMRFAGSLQFKAVKKMA